jgi:hypothetical protein
LNARVLVAPAVLAVRADVHLCLRAQDVQCIQPAPSREDQEDLEAPEGVRDSAVLAVHGLDSAHDLDSADLVQPAREVCCPALVKELRQDGLRDGLRHVVAAASATRNPRKAR